jgi:glutaminase
VTLANMGINPVTGQQVFGLDYVKDVLAVMFTCGLYDYAGEWAYRVGLPAKSGVGGGIMAVVNRQLGIAVYSPRLDAKGNSVRGIAVCRELALHLGLHAFEFTNVGSSFMEWLTAAK